MSLRRILSWSGILLFLTLFFFLPLARILLVGLDFSALRSGTLPYTLRVLGFTLFSPEERAEQLLKDEMLGTIEQELRSGSPERAEVLIRFALLTAQGANALRLSDGEKSLLEQRLAEAARQVSERTLRVWRLYLTGCSQGFALGWMNLHQILGSRQVTPGTTELPLTRRWMYP